ncbi:hypothetical protein [Chondromyces apiculatus]|uniref:Uncharacterized protein n=1 Tax=Chondromyces apiculatus DSM 436 TaxID=1192034 RepID=A0A017STC8_9BACT|nr:hypothetical protein [Chondromyces apiculatus]EYF00219.1 Hypothetical protein CAP_1061 [Chondromyces apiculatus DSM 436]
MEALSALRGAAGALLAAEGAHRLAGFVERAELEMVGAAERWTLGAREVSAARLVLVVDAPTYAALSGDAALLGALREAFARAVRTPETELAGLDLALRLPGVQKGWHRAYRDAVPRAAPERPEPEAVLGGAAALLDATNDPAAAAVVRRAQLEAAELPAVGSAILLRYVLRMDPADRAALDRDAALAERVRRAVREAGARPAASVAGVELATALRPLQAADDVEARLTRALVALGAVVVPVTREAARVELAVIADGQLRRVEILARMPQAPRSPRGADTSGSLRWQLASVPTMTLTHGQLEGASEASAVAALLLGGT